MTDAQQHSQRQSQRQSPYQSQQQFQQIDAEQARQMLDQGAAVVDIRDPDSYRSSHIPGARHLDNQNLQQFIDQADLDAALLVYCFHGLSSQSAAQFLIERGFDAVYSLAGGFEAWQQRFPQRCVSGPDASPPDTSESQISRCGQQD